MNSALRKMTYRTYSWRLCVRQNRSRCRSNHRRRLSNYPSSSYLLRFAVCTLSLALRRTFEIAGAFSIELKLRPVLPMLMRGLQVPPKKMIYIANDAAREAERADIAFGKFADPLGSGVERCMVVFIYAESEKRAATFCCRPAMLFGRRELMSQPIRACAN